jgi:predicted metal-dependent hydrolase
VFSVEVVRSTRRKRTVGARMVGRVLRVSVPSWMSAAEERRWVDEMTRRFQRQESAELVDLTRRAHVLAQRHGLRRPTSIRWVRTMTERWGSCTPSTGAVRISDRLAAYPSWVRDYVIVHELAHLTHASHDDAFWRLVNHYPLAERARGYLIAKAGDAEQE